LKKHPRPFFILSVVGLFLLTLFFSYQQQKRLSTADQELIEKVESFYNNIFIYKDSAGLVHLTFGYRGKHFTESVHNPADTLELPVIYTQIMSLGVLYPQKVDTMLVIGTGGGKTSTYMSAFMPHLRVTDVEIDPDVVKLAKKYFDYQETPQLQSVAEDGRKFLMRSDATYDLIMLDAYRGPFVPFHLLTVEFFWEVKKRLNPGGAVVQNIEPTTMLFESAVATMRAVFEQVEFYNASGNVIAVAYDGPEKTGSELKEKAEALQNIYRFRYPLPAMLNKRKIFTPPDTIKPLTDDFAPVDSLKSIESHNRKWE
jgi:spermidine synthase